MRYLYLYFALFFTCMLAGQRQWVKLSNQPHRFDNGCTFVTGGIAYYLDRSSNDLWGYYPEMDRWEWVSTFPGDEIYGLNTFSAGKYGYVFSYESVSYNLILWRFDPTNGSWTKNDKIPYELNCYIGSMVTVGEKAYMAAGPSDANGWKYCLWEFNSNTEEWTLLSELPFTLTSMYMFAISGKIYIGGNSIRYDGQHYGYMSVYNPVDSTWKRLDPGPYCTSTGITYWNYINNGIPFIFDGKAYLICSEAGTTCVNKFKMYDPKKNEWSDLKAGVSPRNDVLGFQVGDRGYLGFGRPCVAKDPGSFHADFYTFGYGMPILLQPITGRKEIVGDHLLEFAQTRDQITLHSNSNEPLPIEIIDIFGRCVYRGELPEQEEIIIPTLEYSSGFYQVRAGKEDLWVKKIILNP